MFVGIVNGGRAMRWGALGSIGLIAFMGCAGPVVAQQTQSRPRLAQSYQPAPPPNWTGPQVGGFGGGSYGSPFSFAEPGAHLCPGSGLGPVSPPCFETPFQFSGQPWSGTVGAFAGYNAQFGNVVAGVEGDVAWKRISISQSLSVPPTPVDGGANRSETFAGSMTQRWDGSLRLRLGTLMTPWTLAYGTAGGAVGSVCGSFSYAATVSSPGTSSVPAVVERDSTGLIIRTISSEIPGTPGFTTSAFGADNWCETRVGYTVGAGVETAIPLGYNSKLRFEYRYTDLGSFSRDVPLAEIPCIVGSCSGNAHIDMRAAFHTFRVGLGFGL
jgi:outer membrane immunogenic protein